MGHPVHICRPTMETRVLLGCNKSKSKSESKSLLHPRRCASSSQIKRQCSSRKRRRRFRRNTRRERRRFGRRPRRLIKNIASATEESDQSVDATRSVDINASPITSDILTANPSSRFPHRRRSIDQDARGIQRCGHPGQSGVSRKTSHPCQHQNRKNFDTTKSRRPGGLNVFPR